MLFEDPKILDEFRGLTPRSWICVGAAFSREDVKALLLSEGIAFTGDAVQTFQGLCQKMAGIDPTTILASPGRQEVLRLLLSVPGLKDRLPELKRLKRQGSFLRRLDHAIQSGRMAFAHWEEAEVYGERLAQKLGPNPLRAEIEGLAHAYEQWLESSRLWDPPMVIRQAVERLSSGVELELPSKIFYLNGKTQESLEKSFWEALGRLTEIVFVGASEFSAKGEATPKVSWERWHTLDDAAERLAGSLSEQVRSGEGLAACVTLISDTPSSRRTVSRALSQQGILLSDPRDPTRIRWDETIKWAMLPLDVVARGFERTRVIPFINSYSPASQTLKSQQNRGIRNGLESYSGGKLVSFQEELKKLNLKIGGKKTAFELARAHLSYLEEHLSEDRVWVRGFFEQIWKQMVVDLERVGLGKRRAAPLLWLERLQTRISEAPAPVERIKPQGGLDVYRLHQISLRSSRRGHAYGKVWIFGVPSLWLSGEGVGDYWFSEREREVLGAEFAVRSGMQVRTERAEAIRAWLSGAQEVVFLDALYDPDGRERETIQPIFEVIRESFEGNIELPESPAEHGSHPRWTMSYSALRPVPPQKAELPASVPKVGETVPVISASALENYSRCGFLALARTRWKLEDTQEPETDLWPQMKGILLHEAVRLLVESRDAHGNFSKTAEEVIEAAWLAKSPKGLLRGARIEAYVKRKLAVLLRVFKDQERKYTERAQTRVLALDNTELAVEYPGFSIRGKPDRIDEHPDGLWIIDYKTSSSAPNGSVMLENGYRLQLPFYALAAQKQYSKPALGLQFVQLDKKGTRTNGVYFKPHNGKEPGKLTDTTARSKSLLTVPREDAWAKFEEDIQELGKRYVSGSFEARPRIVPRNKECDSCQVSDFCGFRRIIDTSDSDEGAGE